MSLFASRGLGRDLHNFHCVATSTNPTHNRRMIYGLLIIANIDEEIIRGSELFHKFVYELLSQVSERGVALESVRCDDEIAIDEF